MKRPISGSAAVAFVSLVGMGCQPLPEVRYEGQHVAVAPYFEAEVCGGTVAWLDRTVVEISDLTGLEVPGKTTFYWGWEGVDQHCPGVACSFAEERRVFSMMHAIRHELAHIVGDAVGRADDVIEEGFAVAADDTCAKVIREERPDSFASLIGGATDDNDISVLTAVGGHFASYLIQRWGWRAFVRLKDAAPRGSTPAEFERMFAEIYDLPVEEVTRQWRLEAPAVLCSETQAEVALAAAAWSGQPLRFEASLDCRSNTTMGPIDETAFRVPSFANDIIPGMYEEIWLDVPLGAEVDIAVEGPPGAAVWFKPKDCLWISSDDNELSRENELLFAVDAGESLETHELGACLYRIWFVSDDYEPTVVALEIRPAEDGAR